MTLVSLRQLDRLWKFFAPLFIGLLSVDQLSKEWAVTQLKYRSDVNFGFELSTNKGIVFGFDLPEPLIYILTVGILGLGVYLVVVHRLWQDRWHLFGLALLFSGALGNLIDRIRWGYVVDFIKVYWWPTFNLADVWIVLAILLFAWEFLVREHVGEAI